MAAGFLYHSLLAEYTGISVYLRGEISPSEVVNYVIEGVRHHHALHCNPNIPFSARAQTPCEMYDVHFLKGCITD